MRRVTETHVAASLLLLALGTLAFSGGCSNSTPSDGSQAKVDQKQQEDIQNKMKEFMAKKGQGGGGPKR